MCDEINLDLSKAGAAAKESTTTPNESQYVEMGKFIEELTTSGVLLA